MALEIITYGSGSYVQQTLTSLSALAGSSDWVTLARIAGVVGIVWVMLAAFKNARGGSLQVDWSWFLGFGFIYLGLMVPKVDVAVIDRIESGCGTAPPAIVTGVPVGIAAFGYVTSGLGDGITRLYEQYISLPGDQQYAQNGMLFGSQVARTLTQTRIADSELSADMSSLMTSCVFPMIARGHLPLNEATRSTDLWQTISSQLPNNRWVARSDGSVLSCRALGDELTPEITGNGASQIQAAARQNGGAIWSACTVDDAAARYLASAGGVTGQDMLGINQDAASLTRQAMTINAMQDAFAQGVSETDNAALAQSVFTAQAEQTQRNTYMLMGNMASRTLPVMRAVIEALLYALFPVIMIFMLTPAWLSVLGQYIIVMMWIQLWPPMYAVLNSIMYWYGAPQSQRMAEMSDGSSGLTLDTAASVSYANTDMVALAGYMALTIPMISYMMIRGGAMIGASVASSLNQPMSQAATRSGASLTDASMQSGSVSWDTSQVNTASANQVNTAPNMRFGAATIEESTMAGGTARTSEGGQASYNASPGATSLGNVSASAQGTLESGIQTQAQRAQQAAQEQALAFDQRVQGTAAQQSQLNDLVGDRAMASDMGLSSDESFKYQQAYGQREGLVQQAAERAGVSESDMRSTLSSLKHSTSAGLSTPVASARAEAALVSQGVSQEQASRTVEEAQTVSRSQEYQVSDDYIRQIGERVGNTQTERFGDSFSMLGSAGVAETRDASQRMGASLQESQSWSELQSRVEKEGLSVGGKLDGAIYSTLAPKVGEANLQRMIANANDGGDSADSRALMGMIRENSEEIAGRYFGVGIAGAPQNNVNAAYGGYASGVPGADQARDFGSGARNDLADDAEGRGITGVEGNVRAGRQDLQGQHDGARNIAIENIGSQAPSTLGDWRVGENGGLELKPGADRSLVYQGDGASSGGGGSEREAVEDRLRGERQDRADQQQGSAQSDWREDAQEKMIEAKRNQGPRPPGRGR
ncbi:conjugal transfer protein TraG N-terminal domain-containing protein [Thioalkalivibrio sp. ALMg11]|uniref:conjugal transfer protein TraG N-terminal domain-containing protein n=1 Tax=Thioalkalivibrio sp. ALMg11 TaxID=1158165 RepID=UPI000363E5F8|nr:conjugal transfer protein TraG N-terminal domain-containing protein [Thioalkalivibrio sp. ALMg11]